MIERIIPLAALAALAACAEAPAPGPQAGDAPEGEAMVAAADPQAVAAGLEILRAGGSAVDAAIAVQAALGLVEPQSSGIGGGAFIMHYDAETQAVSVYDGRERAPADAGPELFFDADNEPLDFTEAWWSGRSIGVPGAVDALRLAHEDHGALAWAESFQPAIALAEDGFEVSDRLNGIIVRFAEFGPLDEWEATRDYFFDLNGQALQTGDIKRNPDYAQTLRAIAENPRALLEGEIARDIVAAARAAPRGSALTQADLESYQAERRDAVCRPYRTYEVCSAPPPSSGGMAINAALEILEHTPIDRHGPDGAMGWHYLIEAMRLTYADRDRYVGDPDFIAPPIEPLLDEGYLARRAALIEHGRAMETVEAGDPYADFDAGADDTPDSPGTSHFVVVDANGDVVSMTTTVESGFGSHVMTNGFLLNNQLTDFARSAYDANGDLLVNAPQGGKRPRSSMSPVIVLDAETKAFRLAAGSPGGNSIIAYVLKTVVAILDWGLTPQEAAALSNVVARGDQVRVDAEFDPALVEPLRAMGHDVADPSGEGSGIHAVLATPDGLLGGADPRRAGTAEKP